MPIKRSWTNENLKEAVSKSFCIGHVMRYMNLADSSRSRSVIKNHISLNNIDITHFWTDEQMAEHRTNNLKNCKPLLKPEDRLVVNSRWIRSGVKKYLYSSGIKKRQCEFCGQTEIWRTQKMSLILDHVNGVRNDNRLENLRILCPNCAATLPTHGGKNRKNIKYFICPECQTTFNGQTKYCSKSCAHIAWSKPRINTRKVTRPPPDVLLKEVIEFGYAATGRKYKVRDNTVRKWMGKYKKEYPMEQSIFPPLHL